MASWVWPGGISSFEYPKLTPFIFEPITVVGELYVFVTVSLMLELFQSRLGSILMLEISILLAL